MTNPYASPSEVSLAAKPRDEVAAPAIALMSVAAFAIALGLLGLALDAFLLWSGAIAELAARDDGPISRYTIVAVRTIWGILLVCASCFVFYGGLKMKQLRKYNLARAAAALAVVPLVGPCCVLGIPFGVWAWVVLARPHVRDAFR